MTKADYSLEIDVFSGRPNPVVQITETDFKEVYTEVQKLENAGHVGLFTGLGFRGFIVTGAAHIITIQSNVAIIKTPNDLLYKKSNHSLISKLTGLFGKYDHQNANEILLEKIRTEYF